MKKAFSVIELLVVITLIGVLASLTMAAVGGVKTRARAVQCGNGLRQIGVAANLYSAENGGELPRSQHNGKSWVGTLQPYAGGKILYRCPLDPNGQRFYSYAVNDFLLPHPYGAEELDYSRRSALEALSQTIYLAECADKYVGSDHFHFADRQDGGFEPSVFAAQVAVERHQTGANYLFADGHVEALAWREVRLRLARSGSRFVHPDGSP